MTEYKTVEGHEIKVGEYYETRGGDKVRVIGFREREYIGYWPWPILAHGVNNDSSNEEVDFDKDGYFYNDIEEDPKDIMRPWVEDEKEEKEKEKKVYKLSDMWVCWYDLGSQGVRKGSVLYPQKNNIILEYQCLVAITKADATEFYEGEGLEDIK